MSKERKDKAMNKELENQKNEGSSPKEDQKAHENVEPAEGSIPSVEALMEEIGKLKTLMEKLEEENAQLKEAAMRVTADFYNYRQRIEKEKERLNALAAEKAIKELLPVLDNLDMALSSSCGDDSEKIRSGVEIIRKQFLDVLCKLGLEPIDAVGKDFDPSMHEALAIEEVEPERDGKVLEEYQKGFILGGKVLRASKVKVGKSESKVDEKEEQN
ncbi:GrpE protein [Thermovirga lienii DSM 17291]|jgi:molecular chaperone GrpE (heat shock protein)|uniref:Protein GrpE n=1 Tax=Thermovirga lienii (strain ATCC BAA-1197 / DSM 17291 / Cas60314) TaxID=580340 RepID=G7V6G7_THELD|nr:nucleotide exchange factor GrpE [Thermovirga lienii]AER67080.1 GrpE protein [Thermovirga lienii DSM 17291]KUK41978.1 MAG: Protein GrpE [Thermovirga lienii]MDN5318808.1 molecular chaperone GrpE [Thermovirga sp.]HCD71552.1 nucleotide exchange factor GrpE [Thermovirga lienii]